MYLSEALSANHDVQPVPDRALLDFLADFDRGQWDIVGFGQRLVSAQQTIERHGVRTRDWALSSTER